jgi:hypothetical protein
MVVVMAGVAKALQLALHWHHLFTNQKFGINKIPKVTTNNSISQS